MTTSVLVVNRGPHRVVKVELLERDEQGKAASGGEHLVQPGGHIEMYLHLGRSLVVHEVEAE